MRKRTKKGKRLSEWEKERMEFFERKGIGAEEVEGSIEEIERGEVWSGEWERREMNEILIARLAAIKFPSNHLSNKL